MAKYILAIDQGTTGTTALIVGHKMQLVAKVNQEFRQYFPKPGWVEHDANEIWKSTCQTIRKVLQKSKIKPSDIAAIGITNQRETSLLWNTKTAKPIHKALVWQDRRTSEFCRKNKKQESWIHKKTGLVLDPYFSATKLSWLLKNVSQAKALQKKKQLAFGTIDTWLVWNLTGGKAHVTDVSNASRTLLCNIQSLSWDAELLKFFKVPSSILPEIRSNSEIYGYTKSVPGLPDGIPIAGMAGDQQAALFGQACFQAGEAKCTYGTGSFLLMNLGDKPVFSKSGLITTVAWQLGKKTSYAFEGSSFIAGAAVQWLRDGLQIIKSSPEIEKLAKKVLSSDGVAFVPALSGLGTPHWNPEARGVLCGLTRGTNRNHIARAVLEGVALSQYDILNVMQSEGRKKLKALKVDGGVTQNDLLMQFQADVLKTKLIRPKVIETTAMGAAFLAGLGVGLWKSPKEIQKNFRIQRTFESKMSAKVRKEKIQEWEKAVARAMIV